MTRQGDSTGTHGAAVLDEAYLGRLEEQVGRAAVEELLADGLVEVSDRLDRLAERLAAGDADGVRHLAHDLTSVAGHVGLSELSLAAAACQKTLRAGTARSLAATAAPVLEAGPRACAGLRARLGPGARAAAERP